MKKMHLKQALHIVITAYVSFLCVFAVAQAPRAAEFAGTGTAGGKQVLKEEPALTGDRHPLYRLRKSDVIEIRFTFSPEYDQIATIQPDGFIALKAEGNLFAEGLTLPEVSEAV